MTNGTPYGVESLQAIEEIRQLKSRYFRALDTKDWPLLRSVFTDDARFDVRGAFEMPVPGRVFDDPPVVTGGDAIVAFCREVLAPFVSVHHGHVPEIELTSTDSATGHWPMQDLLHAPAGGAFRTFRGYGFYEERYRKEAQRWCIHELVLSRLFVDIER